MLTPDQLAKFERLKSAAAKAAREIALINSQIDEFQNSIVGQMPTSILSEQQRQALREKITKKFKPFK